MLGGIDEISDFTSEEKDGITLVTAECANEVNAEERLFFAFADVRLPIIRMTAERASLEDIFIELTKSDTDTAEAGDELDLAAEYEAAVEADEAAAADTAGEDAPASDEEEGTEQ